MRISAHNEPAFIELERRDENGHAVFDVSAQVAEFTGRNLSVVLVGVGEFLQRLPKFEATRRGKVVLEGGEQFRLSVGAFDSAGHIWIGFRLCRYVYTPGHPTLPLTMEGGFEFDAEFTIQLVREFGDLLRGHD